MKRFNNLRDKRANWENFWQEVADHSLGRRDFTTTMVTEGRRKDRRIYDASSSHAATMLAAALQSILTNASTKWFSLSVENEDLRDIESVQRWLHDTELRMYAEFGSRGARFSPSISQTYQDIVGFGTSIHFVEDVPGRGAVHSSRPISECYIAQDSHDIVDTVYRRFWFTAAQAVDKWGDGVSAGVKKDIEGGRHENKREYLHAVEPNQDFNPEATGLNRFPVSSHYIQIENKHVLEIGGFEEFPFMVPRWLLDNGETYGRGPAMNALPTQKNLNVVIRDWMIAIQKDLSPPMMVADDGVISQIRLDPNSLVVVRAGTSNQDPIRPIQSGSNLVATNEEITRLQGEVRKIMHQDILELTDKPGMTATHVIELTNRAQQWIGPMLDRIRIELLEPLIERVFNIMLRAGMFIEPPEELSGENILINYIGPAARAQTSADVQAVAGLVNQAIEWGQLNPNLDAEIDFPAALREVGRGLGAPITVFNDKQTKDAILAQRAAAAEAARAQEIQNAQADNLGKVANALPDIGGAGLVQ